MSFKVSLLKMLNKCFPLPVHPFNTQASGEMTYAMWQYLKGEDTIKFYLQHTTSDKMFKDKDVLDVGCGAGGKSLYYLSLGAKSVTGIDVVEYYEQESKELCNELGLEGFTFFVQDAAKTNFADNSFDTIIMNDAMEHVSKPKEVLNEMFRILKPNGKLYVNFPPYNHPYGAHLSDVIGIPWVQALFSDKTLIKAYKDLVKDKEDGQSRISFRIGLNDKGEEYFSYLNKMSIKRFKKLIKDTNFKVEYYHEAPLRNFLKPLCKGLLKEYFVKMAVCVLEKSNEENK